MFWPLGTMDPPAGCGAAAAVSASTETTSPATIVAMQLHLIKFTLNVVDEVFKS
jgi:hypothetical protein